MVAWFLLVPGGGSRPTEAQPSGLLDHYTGYLVMNGPDGPSVTLVDQFMGEQDVDLGSVTRFAVPATTS